MAMDTEAKELAELEIELIQQLIQQINRIELMQSENQEILQRLDETINGTSD